MESENPQMPCRKQKNKRRSLPPGIYSIQFGKRAVVCPSNNGETLFVDGINPSQPSQMWLIGGNGSIMSLSASGRYTSTWPSAIATAPVTRSTDPYLWIINVKRGIKDGTFVGWIMSSDIGMVSWCLNGTNVQMQSEQMEWTFVDLTVAPGSDTNEPDRRQMLAHGAIKTLSHPLGLNDTVSFCVRVVNFGQDHVRTLNSAVNLMSGEGDYLLHIGFRPLENVIVFNTRKGPEEWAPEEKKILTGVFQSKDARIMVTNKASTFCITIDDRIIHTFSKRINKPTKNICYWADEGNSAAFFGNEIEVEVQRKSDGL